MILRSTSFILFLFLSITTNLFAQSDIERVDPPHWWQGFQNDSLQLLIKGSGLVIEEVSIEPEGLSYLDHHSSANGEYLFIDLKVEKSGVYKFKLKGKKKLSFSYSIKNKNQDPDHVQGLDQSDFIYLLMPDRFANGDPSNDVVDEMHQNTMQRDSIVYRHGGDLQGIIDHLDHISDLGVTALWLNPVEENDQPKESYHGYAITDHYAIDRRLGSNELYQQLSVEADKQGVKMIRDVVFNHFGNKHYLIQSPPDSSWVHQWDKFTQTNYRATTRLDPYASEKDLDQFERGWFDHHMPDMNYRNNDLSRYMIQNSLWWVEEFGIDAYRIDTYIYPHSHFMERWARELKVEYPDLFLFAETWVHGSVIQAWFAGGDRLGQGETYLDGVTDFQLYFAISKGLNEKYEWSHGISRVYYTLVEDVIYAHPEKNVTFLDNHDIDRFYGVVKEDWGKFKLGYAMLMTLRGIPSIQYGSEILMPQTGHHGVIRTDYPGGWPNDQINKFTKEGRDSLENVAYDYIKHLADWRSDNEAITKGDLTQFYPDKGSYAYIRHTENKAVLMIINQSEKSKEYTLDNYAEVLGKQRNFKNVITGESSEEQSIKIAPGEFKLLEFDLL